MALPGYSPASCQVRIISQWNRRKLFNCFQQNSDITFHRNLTQAAPTVRVCVASFCLLAQLTKKWLFCRPGESHDKNLFLIYSVENEIPSTTCLITKVTININEVLKCRLKHRFTSLIWKFGLKKTHRNRCSSDSVNLPVCWESPYTD